MELVKTRNRRVTQCAAALLVLAIGAGCSDADTADEAPVATAPPVPASTTTTTLPPTTPAPAPETTLPPTTLAPTTTVEAVTTTTLPPGAALTMRGDGLGTTFFGAEAESVIAYLTSVLGPPTQDSGWGTAFDSPFGVCPGSEARGVGWFDLLLLFSDSTEFSSSGRHLFYYQYGGNLAESQPDGLRTEIGLTVGDSIGRVRELLPDVEINEDELFGTTFLESPNGLAGYLTSSADDGVVQFMTSGQACGE
jgi:hypothetical protein